MNAQTDHHPLLTRSLTNLARTLEIGDAVILIYIVAFVRQYLWIVSNNPLAWLVTVLLSVLIWFFHLRTRDRTTESTPFQFWLMVALPLLALYAMRAAFPDTTFDVLDYRLINSERALRGFPFISGDFFPTRFPFNPAPDMVTGLLRHLLGYRLGTIVNYVVVLWIGSIINRLLTPYIKSAWFRCACVLLLLLTEHVLFVINNYMVDLLALPLLLEAARLSFGSTSRQSQSAVRIGLYLGASVAFKLTNLAFALPILAVYAHRSFLRESRDQLLRRFLFVILAFAVPILPFTLYIFWQTGNPVFPLYNRIFRSAFWPAADFVGVRWSPVIDDPRWLNMRWWEQLLWPILVPFKLEHTAGGLGPHAGRLSLGFIAAFLGLLLRTKDRAVGSLSFITFFGAILWSVISGMLRYATFLELAGGVVVIYLAARFYDAQKNSKSLHLFKRGAVAVVFGILIFQSAVACVYSYRFEWGSRPTFFEQPKAYVRDSKYLLNDYSLRSFLAEREKVLIEPVGAWAETNALESGIEVLLKNDAPALCLYMPEFFHTEKSKSRFRQSLEDLRGKRVFSLCFSEHLEGSLSNITAAGLRVGRITPVVIPYYSEHTRIHMTLIEVLLPGDSGPENQIKITRQQTALSENAFRAEIVWSQFQRTSFRAGLKETVYVKVRNASDLVWPALGLADGKYRLAVGNHWLDDNHKMVINDDGRNPLPYDLGQGEEIEMPLTITAPETPGNYVLEIDMVQEGVTWFGLKGSSTLRLRVRVE